MILSITNWLVSEKCALHQNRVRVWFISFKMCIKKVNRINLEFILSLKGNVDGLRMDWTKLRESCLMGKGMVIDAKASSGYSALPGKQGNALPKPNVWYSPQLRTHTLELKFCLLLGKCGWVMSLKVSRCIRFTTSWHCRDLNLYAISNQINTSSRQTHYDR